MKKIYLLTTLCLCMTIAKNFACNCGPAHSEETLDEKVYSGASYLFFTAEILAVESAFHLEVTFKIDHIFYGSKLVKDPLKPVTVFFDLRTECAILQSENIKAGNKLFITTAFNSMGRMFITNNCDAFFPAEELETHQLTDYLESLKTIE
jgi:hypothetical protein